MMSVSTDDPYRVLKVRRTATLDEIKIARKRWELKLHPDKQDPHATDEFRRQCAEKLAAVRAAFAKIGTKDARAEHDAAWAKEHPAAAVVMEASEAHDEDSMEASEFWSRALHSLAVVLITAAARPVLTRLALPDVLGVVGATLTMLAAAFLALTAPLRLGPRPGLWVATFVIAAVVAIYYPVHEYGAEGFFVYLVIGHRAFFLLLGLCLPRAAARCVVLLVGAAVAPFGAAFVRAFTPFGLMQMGSWLLHTWALLGATSPLLFIPAAQAPRKAAVLPLCLGAVVGLVSRLRMCGVALEASKNAMDLLEQCAGSTAVDLLVAQASTTLLLALAGLFFFLLASLTSAPIPYEEPFEVAKPRLKVKLRTELADGDVADLLDVAEDFEEIAEASGPATCQANPETSLSERKYGTAALKPHKTMTPEPGKTA